MQTVGGTSSITDQVESLFAVPSFHAVVYFSGRNFRFTHHDLEMPDQGFHLGIDIFFFW